MVIGFAMLVAFAIVAAEAKTTAAAIMTGSLGAVGAALAANIGKTCIRSQESAAAHLRGVLRPAPRTLPVPRCGTPACG